MYRRKKYTRTSWRHLLIEKMCRRLSWTSEKDIRVMNVVFSSPPRFPLLCRYTRLVNDEVISFFLPSKEILVSQVAFVYLFTRTRPTYVYKRWTFVLGWRKFVLKDFLNLVKMANTVDTWRSSLLRCLEKRSHKEKEMRTLYQIHLYV